MDNFFTKKMTVKSDSELQNIISNKNGYQEEALVAAIEELEKRSLAPDKLSNEKQDLVVKHEERKKEEEKIKTEKKKALIETIKLLKPTREYFVTPIIIYLNVFVFILMGLMGVHPVEPSVEALISWGGNLREITLNGQQWRLLTNIFLHGGIFHLLLNMYALLHIGSLLESKFRNTRYLFAYIITGIFASGASILINDNVVSVGASGAIFGMYGLTLSLLLLKSIELPEESRKNLMSSILFFIGYNLLYGFTKEGIDNSAHIGGLMSGFIIGFIYYPSLKNAKYSKYITSGITLVILFALFLIPKFYTSKVGEFQAAMKEFSVTEEKALWMYREDLSYIPPEKTQYYYNKLRNEGIDLWQSNLKLLESLTDLPTYLEVRVDLLLDYCRLRIQSCETMQYLLKYNRGTDKQKIVELNSKIEQVIKELEALNN